MFASDTIVPTSTITSRPNPALDPNIWLGEMDGPAPIPDFPTDINGPYYQGAYDATILESAISTLVQGNSTMS
jgi:hypothetical protein